MPAFCAAFWQARKILFVPMGRSGTLPGKSHSVGRFQRQYAASRSRKGSANITCLSLVPFTTANPDHMSLSIEVAHFQIGYFRYAPTKSTLRLRCDKRLAVRRKASRAAQAANKINN